jgi:hypothetical protein
MDNEYENALRAGGIAWDKPRQPRRDHSRAWAIAALITGGVLLLARLIAPGVHGLVFKGSIDQVQGICSSGLGVMAQAANTAAAHSCSDASTAMTILNVLAVLGILLLIAGGVDLLLKAVRHAAQQAHVSPPYGR